MVSAQMLPKTRAAVALKYTSEGGVCQQGLNLLTTSCPTKSLWVSGSVGFSLHRGEQSHFSTFNHVKRGSETNDVCFITTEPAAFQ